jgi:hypothetical protein
MITPSAFAICLLTVWAARAEGIQGTVLEDHSGSPVLAASVRLKTNTGTTVKELETDRSGAFVIPVRERVQFKEAIRTKLILEIAELTSTAPVRRVQQRKPLVSCTIGEQMWRDRWGN